MTDSTPTFTGTYQTDDGSTVTVEAVQGTQAIGRIINSTDFGSVTLRFSDQVIRFTSSEDLDHLRDLIRLAYTVAESRNRDNDQPLPAQN